MIKRVLLLLLSVSTSHCEVKHWGQDTCKTVTGSDNGEYLILGECIGGQNLTRFIDLEQGKVQNVSNIEIPYNGECVDTTMWGDILFTTCGTTLLKLSIRKNPYSYLYIGNFTTSDAIVDWSMTEKNTFISSVTNDFYEFWDKSTPDSVYTKLLESWKMFSSSEGYLVMVSDVEIGFFHSPPIPGEVQFNVRHSIQEATSISSNKQYSCVLLSSSSDCVNCTVLQCYSSPWFIETSYWVVDRLDHSSMSVLEVKDSFVFVVGSSLSVYNIHENRLVSAIELPRNQGIPKSIHVVITSNTSAHVYYMAAMVGLYSVSVNLFQGIVCSSCFPFDITNKALDNTSLDSLQKMSSPIWHGDALVSMYNSTHTIVSDISRVGPELLSYEALFTTIGLYRSGCEIGPNLIIPSSSSGDVILYSYVTKEVTSVTLPRLLQSGWGSALYSATSQEIYLIPEKSNSIVVLNSVVQTNVTKTIQIATTLTAIDRFKGAIIKDEIIYLSSYETPEPMMVHTGNHSLKKFVLQNVTLPNSYPYWSGIVFHAGFVYLSPATNKSTVLMCSIKGGGVCEEAGDINVIGNSGYNGIAVLGNEFILIPSEGMKLVSFKVSSVDGRIVQNSVLTRNLSNLVGDDEKTFSSIVAYDVEKLLLTPVEGNNFLILSHASPPPNTTLPPAHDTPLPRHTSDDGVTLGVVLFFLIFAVIFFTCCLYFHTIESSGESKSYVKYQENSEVKPESPSPQQDKKEVEEELDELTIAE